MRVSTALTLFLLCLALGVAACNKPAKPGAGGTAGEQTTAAAQTGGAAGQAQSGNAQQPAEKKAPEHLRTPANPVLGGTWFALFGRHDNSVEESSWENGHRVRFIEDGNNLWVRVENGWNVAAMNAKYEVMDDTVRITFSPRSAVEYGLSKIAPLGLGRDEEVGLLSKTPGRDTEIGLEDKTAGEKAGDAERVENLKFIVDGDLLVLTDSKTNVMVYARVKEQAPQAAPDVTGSWLGNVAGTTGVAATASGEGGKLKLAIDGGKGQFDGQYVQGYFVGKLQQNSQLSFAVLYPAADGSLNGMLLPDPYAKPDQLFDFQRASASPPAKSPVQ